MQEVHLGISVLSVPGKVFGTVLIERIQVVAMRGGESGKYSVTLCWKCDFTYQSDFGSSSKQWKIYESEQEHLLYVYWFGESMC